MFSVSLPLLLISSALVSGILVWLNRGGVGAAGAAAATLGTYVAVAVVQFSVFGCGLSKPQAVKFWRLFVLLPRAVVFGVSRLSVFQNRPW